MTEHALRSGRGGRGGELQLALACAMIGAGGALLGLQVDGNGTLSGTGFTTLALGGLVALVATLIQLGAAGRLPRDPSSAISAVMGFLGITFLIAGVLAPGGAWMFWELLVLCWVLARRRRAVQPGGPEVGAGGLLLLSLMLLFRLWILWQGSRHEWQLFTVDVPVLSSLPFAWLEPVKHITIGDFSQQEMGFPPAGLDFAISTTLWTAGFTLCAVGLWLRNEASRELEIERIHALVEVLPPAVGLVVTRLLPESEWERLGLYGLSEWRLARRMEQLVAERVQSQLQLEAAFHGMQLAPPGTGEGFPASIHQVLAGYSASSTPPLLPEIGVADEPTPEEDA
jgi:hypothetical protein